jgi:hypothetical protein
MTLQFCNTNIFYCVYQSLQSRVRYLPQIFPRKPFLNMCTVHFLTGDLNGVKCELPAEFLDEILRVFILAIHSHLSYSFALRFLFLQTHATSDRFYSSVTVQVHCNVERRQN